MDAELFNELKDSIRQMKAIEKGELAPARVRVVNSENDVAQARQDAMLEIRDTLGWSVKRIGRLFSRDHTTVLHSLRVAEARAGI